MPFTEVVSARVAVLVNPVGAESTPDQVDVLTQAETVSAALNALGYRASTVDFDPSLDVLSARIPAAGYGAVFNLVEEVSGQNRMQYLAPSLLEVLGLTYTGNGPESLMLTTDKILAKTVMKAHGIPTPEWQEAGGDAPRRRSRAAATIFKPRWEDASVGIDEDLIGDFTPAQVAERLRGLHEERGMLYFAERYVDGREFNVSLLEVGGVPTVLPVVEQEFRDYPSGKHRVVGYRAKWVEGSFEFANTVHRHAFTDDDRDLIDRIHVLSLACWRAFFCSGYVRVDFRVDGDGRPWVLEVNANPCLSPDAGFVHAARLAGLTVDDTVRLILDSARSRGAGKLPTPGGRAVQPTSRVRRRRRAAV